MVYLNYISKVQNKGHKVKKINLLIFCLSSLNSAIYTMNYSDGSSSESDSGDDQANSCFFSKLLTARLEEDLDEKFSTPPSSMRKLGRDTLVQDNEVTILKKIQALLDEAKLNFTSGKPIDYEKTEIHIMANDFRSKDPKKQNRFENLMKEVEKLP